MTRLVAVLTVVMGCAHGGLQPKMSACMNPAGADPGACIDVADARMKANDEVAARQYVEAAVDALEAAPACLRDHPAKGCFEVVVLLLGEDPVGLLADFPVSQDLRLLAPKDQGNEATNPRSRARNALNAMCGNPAGAAIDRERACIVLGDLVEEERVKRCGEGCDVATAKLGGWGASEVIDGYGAACKAAGAGTADPRRAAFADEVRRLYAVPPAADPACGLATSPMRGASIRDAIDNMRRIRDDVRAREAAGKKAEEREALRLAVMRQTAKEQAEKAAKEAQIEAAKQLKSALESANWALAYELIKKRSARSPVDEPSATALAHVWDSFLAWAISQGTPMSVYVDVADAFTQLPAAHPLVAPLAALRARALVDIKARAKNTRGRGGAWMYAALAAKVAGPDSPDAKAAFEQYEKLVESVRVSLVIDKLAPSCTELFAQTPGRKVRATANLTCSVVREKKLTAQEPFTVKQHVVHGNTEEDVVQQTMVDVTHRTFSIVVHGTVTIQGKTTPVDFDETLDDRDNSSTRTFEQARAAAIDAIFRATVGPIEAANAATALAAGQKALGYQRQGAAENSFVTHALLAGSSPELDEILTPFGVTFADLQLASR
ncbi:MAG TPA: hypothetical protein VLB44_12865 [Kofleriaceae bacterium]|nr:hypothetical protein [Kofleriaceae bacterium]